MTDAATDADDRVPPELVDAETYGSSVGNRDGNPDVWVKADVAEALGLEIGDVATITVVGERAIITPGPDEPELIREQPVRARAGETVTVEIGADELEAARDRLGDDADRLDALAALADVADLGERYRTDDGRDAIAAVLAETADNPD